MYRSMARHRSLECKSSNEKKPFSERRANLQGESGWFRSILRLIEIRCAVKRPTSLDSIQWDVNCLCIGLVSRVQMQTYVLLSNGSCHQVLNPRRWRGLGFLSREKILSDGKRMENETTEKGLDSEEERHVKYDQRSSEHDENERISCSDERTCRSDYLVIEYWYIYLLSNPFVINCQH